MLIGSESKNLLFILGCPRSGTTALWTTLTAAKEIVMGVERYGDYFSRTRTLTPDMFTFDRFFDLRSGDTFYNDLEKFSPYYNNARKNFHESIWVGDKIPRLYENIENLIRDLPAAKFIMPLRNIFDVANSYRSRQLKNEGNTWPSNFGVSKAIEDWNRSLEVADANKNKCDLILLNYDDLFYSNSEIFSDLLKKLSISCDQNFTNVVESMRSNAVEIKRKRIDLLTNEDYIEIKDKAHIDLYEKLVKESRILLHSVSTISGN